MPDPPIVVGLGELLWDVFPDLRRPGGAPANVAFQAGQLGCRGTICSRVGCDPLGDELVRFLSGQGLATDWVQRDPLHPTGTVTVDASRANHPTYVIHENVAWDHIALDRGLRQLISSASAVCFGTLAQRSATSRATIQEALTEVSRQCLIVYDVNLRQHWYDREWIESSLAKAHYVKLNTDEVTVLSDLLEIGAADHFLFAEAIRQRYQVDVVCVTRGAAGCVMFGDGETVDREGVAVKVADAVGAGDAFTAAWIYGRLQGWPLKAQAAFANEVGAMVASRPGAMPPLRHEFARLAERFP
ncbi:MAG: carbohydrate kinase [Pirellulales bacterium]|nr:carbohydrate kinase [Pirellulales bacterium]